MLTIHNVHIHMGQSALGAALLSAFKEGPPHDDGLAEAPATTTLKPGIWVPPSIGSHWADQGGVYVGNGRGQNGGRDYALILGTDPRTIFKKRVLGTYEIDVTGAASWHDGPANTAALAAAGSELCKDVLALEVDGFKDYYLMSRTDAWLCMANVPELFEKEWYLTSSQYSSYGAWVQYFGDGTTYNYGKKFEACARVCRRLFL